MILGGEVFDLFLIDKICIIVMEFMSYISYLVGRCSICDFMVIGNECFCVLGEVFLCKEEGIFDVVGDFDMSFLVRIFVDMLFIF